ncbi:MAG TPA: VOC family protein [Candidatus Acidoferrum sp.]|nr:VOC family protein [Candidatus Acidoferrum sp.]
MSDRKPLPGKFVWFEHVSRDAKKAQAFLAEVFGWRVEAMPMGPESYEMIYSGDTMIGGYASPKGGQSAHWIAYVSVDDVDAAAKAAAASGGKVVDAPADIPGVGRWARIADPQGAEICPFKNAGGDPPDETPPAGRFFWNELHTTDPAAALKFYEKVLGFAHRSVDMGPGGTYHVLSRGGVERGGATSHLPAGVAPHWLPYVTSDDVDATIARAKKLGAAIPMAPEDIPGIGRFAVLKDPTGAVLAVMKPLPREKA